MTRAQRYEQAKARYRTHRTERRKKRKRLREQGYTEEQIELIMAPMMERQQQQRTMMRTGQVGPVDETLNVEHEPWTPPDDKGYRPTRTDPLLVGTARATGATARVVRRGTTITKYQHDEEAT